MKDLLEKTRRPDIVLRPSGCIDISARIARAMSLRPGDILVIAADNGEYYLHVRVPAADVVGRHDGLCLATRPGSGSLRCWSVRLARLVRQAARNDSPILRLACGSPVPIDGKTFVPLIIHSNL